MCPTFNRLARASLMLMWLVPVSAMAWQSGGVAVAPVTGRAQFEPRVLLGRESSVLAFWTDGRWLDGSDDVYGQLLSRYGRVKSGWPDTGLMIARARDSQRPVSGLSHPDGSFIVGLADYRNAGAGGTSLDQYISRVLPDGRIDPTWPRHGFQVTELAGGDWPRLMAWVAPDTLVTLSGTSDPDGVGRLLFQSVAITPAGPQRVWDAAGKLYQWRPTGGYSTAELAPDGMGGVFAVFDDIVSMPDANTILDTDLYVMRLGRDGLPAAGWESGARPISVAPGLQEMGRIIEDGAGGLYVAWADARDGAGLAWPEYMEFEDIRLLRLTSEGAPYPGWPADGLLVSAASSWQYMPNLLLDGAGGVYVSWDDVTIGLTRVRGDGTYAPGWAQNGIQVSDLFAYASHSRLVLGGVGDLYVLFEDVGRSDLYLQHILPSGIVDPSWPSSGDLAAGIADGDFVSDGAGGCYVTFLKRIVATQPAVVHVARYSVDGVVPVKLAEATVDAEPGRVRITWHGAEGTASEFTVQRRPDGIETWTSLGSPTVRSRDLVDYEDTTVEPGGRYAYRLTHGVEILSEEKWVTVPTRALFALAGARPNPALAREASVEFTLTGSSIARLEVLDLAGRRVHARSLDALGPGRHTLSLAEARLAPGVHWLRLTEGTQMAQSRFVVVR